MNLRTLALAALLVAPSVAASAEEASTEPFDLSALTCWEVTTLPEDESAFVIALMIGYLQGEAGEAVMTPADIAAQVEALDANCVDTPDEPALNALKYLVPWAVIGDDMTDAPAKLLREADRSAEVLIGAVRLGVAACLGVLVAATMHRLEIDPKPTFAVIAAYAMLGFFSVMIARSSSFTPFTPFVLIVIEALIVTAELYIGLTTSNASPTWLLATPAAIWAIIVLTLQSLRFRIELQVFASVAILLALVVVALSGSGDEPRDGATFLEAAFDPLSNAIRFFLLILLSFALTVSVWRSRRMLRRIRMETEASMNLGRFLPQEIRSQASV